MTERLLPLGPSVRWAKTLLVYEVEWVHPAMNDLWLKVRTREVRRELQDVARTALDRHHAPWGGRVVDLYWRRGVTAGDETSSDSHDGDAAEPREHARDFVLVYQRTAAQLPRCYVVLAVLSNPELLEALRPGTTTLGPLGRAQPPNGTTRRSRVTRRPGDAPGRR